MTNNLEELINKYRDKGIFVDSELLILYIVGSTNHRLLGNTKITSNFDENDFILVTEVLDAFKHRITSPHILTEVSDLLGETNEFHHTLQKFIEFADEKNLPSIEIAKGDSFLKLGLADSAIIEISKDSYLVFTDDQDLYGYLANIGIDAVKFSLLKLLMPIRPKKHR